MESSRSNQVKCATTWTLSPFLVVPLMALKHALGPLVERYDNKLILDTRKCINIVNIYPKRMRHLA